MSTVDGRQDPETQLRQLREYAERRGFPVAREYVDHASGAKNDRAEYRAMLEAARRELEGYVAPALDPGVEAALADFIARRERELPDRQD